MSVATLASLMLQSSSSFWMRLHSWAALADHLRAVARQVTQLPDLLGRHEAGPQQPDAQQGGQPLGILDVGLAARHVLDVLGVDQHDFQAGGLQDVEDRLPVDAGTLQGDVAAAAPARASGPTPATGR